MEAPTPPDPHAAAFLAAIRHDRPQEAARLLAEHPGLAAVSVATAAAAGDEALVARLLAHDPAAAIARDDHGVPPLVYACAAWDATLGDGCAERLVACARRLLDAGESPDAALRFDPGDPDSRIPALYFAASRGNVPMTRLLLERGAEPNDGESLYHAAEWNRREVLDLLREHGADVSGPGRGVNNTPLHFVVTCLHDESRERVLGGMRWLLEHGADPDRPSGESGETPLHAAARVPGSAAVMDLLLAAGADPARPRRDGATPYALALRHGRRDNAAHLATCGADTSVAGPLEHFLDACLAGEEARARALLDAHPRLFDGFGPDERGRLASAAAEQRAEAVRTMLALGFDPAWEGTWAGTALHHVCWHGQPDLARLLLAHRAPVDARDRQFGSSALGWACHGSVHGQGAAEDYLVVVDLLIDAGAGRVAATNRWGEPPESLASPAVARRLIERGFAPPAAAAGAAGEASRRA